MKIKYKKNKSEHILSVVTVILLILVPVSNVYTKALVSETNIEYEEMVSLIDSQEKVNESLEMQINELASLENIQSVASEHGLSYINGNIKNVKGD